MNVGIATVLASRMEELGIMDEDEGRLRIRSPARVLAARRCGSFSQNEFGRHVTRSTRSRCTEEDDARDGVLSSTHTVTCVVHSNWSIPVLVLALLFLQPILASRQDHFPYSHTPIRTSTHHPPFPLPIRFPGRTPPPSGKPRHDRPTHRSSPRDMHVPRKRRLEGVHVHVRIKRGRREVCRDGAGGKGERGDASGVVRPFVGAFLCKTGGGGIR